MMLFSKPKSMFAPAATPMKAYMTAGIGAGSPLAAAALASGACSCSTSRVLAMSGSARDEAIYGGAGRHCAATQAGPGCVQIIRECRSFEIVLPYGTKALI